MDAREYVRQWPEGGEAAMSRRVLARTAPVSGEMCEEVVAALRRQGATETEARVGADALVERIQLFVFGQSIGSQWPTKTQVKKTLTRLLRLSADLYDGLEHLDAQCRILLHSRFQRDFSDELVAVLKLRLALEDLTDGPIEVLAPRTARVHCLVWRSAAIWRRYTGAWPAATNDTGTGIATSPFLALLRRVVKHACGDRVEAPRISDHVFHKALKEAKAHWADAQGAPGSVTPPEVRKRRVQGRVQHH
jgi:hypothetical protein